MKAVGAIFVILALVIGIVPQFTDCQSQGRSLTLDNGKTVPMKCHWSAEAAIATAVPLGTMGILMALSKRKETRRMIGISAGVLGAATILIPTALIGVCASSDMLCNMILRPTLVLSGSLAILTSIFVLFTQFRPEELPYDLHPAGA